MQAVDLGDVTLHVADEGPRNGPVVVFSNSLGTDFRLWNAVLPLLPTGLRLVRYDKRGHGLSDLPEGDWGMADHVSDLTRLADHLSLRNIVICGLSVGGIIAQGAAAERPDLVRAIVLCDTGAKIGHPDLWNDRIAAVEAGGIASISDQILERWFTPEFRASTDFAIWRNMLCRTTAGGYIGTSKAIRDTDLVESTARLRLPCLGIGGDQDGSTPPDLVRETTALIPNSRFELIRDAGHLPCVEQPEVFANHLSGFLAEIGHV
ncbi:MAG: 3-oxoadipate enol-lactonase [Pseudomonadota bacterium]